MSLFGNSTGNRSASKNLVEFRAGKMYMKGRMVHPDKRKGMLSVYQSDDSLMHFCWKDRTKGTTDDDLIIFPDDVEFKHVTQCTTGRVYLLKFKSTSRKMFFWMQEPKTDKDEENCRKVNDFLNNPPTPGSSRGGGGGGALGGLPQELANLGGDSDLQSLLGNLSQQQLMQLLGGVGMGGVGGLSSLVGGRPGSAQSDSTPPSRVQSSPGPRGSGSGSSETPQPARPVTAAALPSQTGGSGTTTTTTTPTTTTTTTPAAGGNSSGGGSGGGGKPSIQLSDLQTILSGMGGMGAAGGGEEKEGVDLGTAITPEAMLPILANAEVQERLIPFLPEGETLPKTEAELKNTVQSPQFQQAMNSFSAALASGQLGPLMGQFELGDDVAAAATQGDVEAFAKAMQGALAKKKEEEDAEMKDESKDNE